MQDHPEEFNKSVWNPVGEGNIEMEKDEEVPKHEKKDDL